MVRHYKIHTNIDGSDNKILDMTSGKIRFYQPSDLGFTVNTNVWNSHGIGIFGDSTINHPSIEFRLETFGDTLEENYKIFNEFITLILSQKYVTLEYTTEIGSYFSDIKLSKVSKKEGYGFNGTFSETISFDVINKWYVYEQLTFSKFKNADFSDKTKIHAPFFKNQENFNLLDGTKDFSGVWWSHEAWETDGTYKGLTVKKRTAQWQGISKPFTAQKDGAYTFSAYIKSSGNSADITRFVNCWDINGNEKWIVPNPNLFMGNSFDWLRDSFTVNMKTGDTLNPRYEISGAGTDSIVWTAGHKWEEGTVATSWMPSANEAKEMEGYTYTDNAYVYTTEDNIERFSKWKIEENVFSFVARLTPSNSDVKKYGVRFLDEQANEYTSIIFNMANKPDYIQLNTDTNDEYYQTVTNGIAVNMFSALDFQKFRTRIFKKGTMELVNLDTVEMNIKRKVDFV